MKSLADTCIWLTMLLLLGLACSPVAVYAQREDERDQPAQSSGQIGPMEERQGGQDSMGQRT
jgi:hypothetical protein